MPIRLGVAVDRQRSLIERVVLASGLGARRGPRWVPSSDPPHVRLIDVACTDIPSLVLDGSLDLGLTTVDAALETLSAENSRAYPRSFGEWKEIRLPGEPNEFLVWAVRDTSLSDVELAEPARALNASSWDAETGRVNRLVCLTTHPKIALARFGEWQIEGEVREVPDPIAALAAATESGSGVSYCALAMVDPTPVLKSSEIATGIQFLTGHPLATSNLLVVANAVQTSSKDSRKITAVLRRFERASTSMSNETISLRCSVDRTASLETLSGVVYSRLRKVEPDLVDATLFVRSDAAQLVLDRLGALGFGGAVLMRHNAIEGLPNSWGN